MPTISAAHSFALFAFCYFSHKMCFPGLQVAARPRASGDQKGRKLSVHPQLSWPIPQERPASIALHLAPTLAVRNPSAVELYCKLLLLVDDAPLADDDRLQCAGAWLCNQMAGPVPTVDTISGKVPTCINHVSVWHMTSPKRSDVLVTVTAHLL